MEGKKALCIRTGGPNKTTCVKNIRFIFSYKKTFNVKWLNNVNIHVWHRQDTIQKIVCAKSHAWGQTWAQNLKAHSFVTLFLCNFKSQSFLLNLNHKVRLNLLKIVKLFRSLINAVNFYENEPIVTYDPY